MKVIIVGAGLSGLSTAIALRKFIPASQPLEVKIYDNINPATGQATEQVTPQVRTSRLGAGLGLQANGLRVLEDLDPALKQRVYAAGFPCTRFTWKTASDWLLGHEYVDVLPISRPLLINCLYETLPSDSVIQKKIAKVVTRQGRKPVVQFEDGSPDETADLVVGADGIRSTVRHDLFGDDEKYRPQYVGICAVGQEQAALLQLRERHGNWTDPLISQCLENAHLDNVYPIFVMPDLPYWGRDGCVLVGDAAHALPPRSGQGASQAFEDGEALALLLAGYLEREHDAGDAISRSILGLFEVRAPRVNGIKADALRWKEPKMPMSWLRTAGLYISLFILVRVRRVLNIFTRRDLWNVRDAVSKYLAQ
ncbi:uncharacterized protein F4812DRAFT_461529 [Daldinia caldariorum]|uniref:uncharacterized protein n=1 Tax=Daldinia caldariorum TaxID=326644 RepID=UPI0020085A53|nr:uncharacterized protein F4812DRAFT_461529 [Daldinia caldariorum]KAI1465842.1 hypothetical protein F4812DRAFT_461529 [Daldinia caldariorum]